MDLPLDQQIRRKAESMQQFAGEAPTFQYGEYRAWEQACSREGRTIPPEEFRATAVTYHAEYGQVATSTVTPEMLDAA